MSTLRSLFIASPAIDGFFFFGSAGVVLLAWLAAARFQVNSFYILAAVAVFSNGPHLVSTWSRVYFDRREWRRRPFHLLVVPAVIALLVVAVVHFGGREGSRALNSILLYWATWHFVAQSWGILRIYQRRSGEPENSLAMRLEKPLLFLFVAWCLLHRLHTGPRMLFGTEVHHLPLPRAVVDGLLGPFLFLFFLYLVQRLRQWRAPWAQGAWLRAGFLGCSFLGFAVPFLFIKTDDTTAFAAAAGWHGLQYLGIVRLYHRNAWKGGVHPDAPVVSWLSQPGWGRLVLYAAFLLALAGSGYLFIYTGALLTAGSRWDVYTWGAVVWLSFTFGHYYMDGVIWKLSKSPEVAARVNAG
ncbi:MAG: hypothetical protein ACOZIN_19935 [Myxococcota bacterium]